MNIQSQSVKKNPGHARTFDLATSSVRELNQALHAIHPGSNANLFRVLNPRGVHAIAAGVDADVTIEIDGDVGYYCGGMNKLATILIEGNAGIGLGRKHDVGPGPCARRRQPFRRRHRRMAARSSSMATHPAVAAFR